MPARYRLEPAALFPARCQVVSLPVVNCPVMVVHEALVVALVPRPRDRGLAELGRLRRSPVEARRTVIGQHLARELVVDRIGKPLGLGEVGLTRLPPQQVGIRGKS